ncbi:MAG: hypothetical protein ACTSUN_11520 [Promethearchaeota archaeon]
MPKLDYSIVGLQEYSISFQRYCRKCEIQKYCVYGKDKPFTVEISYTDLAQAKERTKFEQLKKLQEKASVETSYEELLKKVRISIREIFSQIWQEKVKSNKDIRCLDSSKVDNIFVSQQGQSWWADFAATMKEINAECEKVM